MPKKPKTPNADDNSRSMDNGLGPLRGELPTTEQMTIKNMRDVFGDSGTQRWSGFFYEEPNAIMRDQSRVQILEEMRRTDGAVKAALNAIKTPILATDWRIEGEDEKIVQFVEDNLFHMKRSWKEFLREALCFFDFGHYVFEIIWDVRDSNVVIIDLAPRIPHSIFRWKMSNGQPGITQLIRTDDFTKPYAEIPIANCSRLPTTKRVTTLPAKASCALHTNILKSKTPCIAFKA